MDDKINNLREFGKFRLDAEKRVLWYEDKPVNLALKEIELLCALTENSGEVVTKDELLNKIWQDSFVEESNLSRHIYILRKTFEELGEKDLIQTIPRRGYRFTDEVREIQNGEIIVERHAVKQTLIEIEDEIQESDEAETQEISAEIYTKNNNRRVFGLSVFRAVVVSVLLLLLASVFAVWRYRTQQAKTYLAEIKSIAVLPFRTIDANKENEHHGMGLTDILITRLSNIKELNVRPTSAVFGFQNEDSISAGQKLQVDAVLEGTIYRTGDKVRVTARLLKVSDGNPIWAAQFEKPFGDELRMQDDIAFQVINALSVDLSGKETTALTKRFTESAAAYELYQKGRYELNKRTGAGRYEAERLFRNAIDKDPNFALAYVGVADCLATGLGDHGAILAVEKALEIDPNLAEAYATSGFLQTFNYWNWKKAEEDFKKSIELNPNYAMAHHWYAELLTIQGRHEEAKAEMRRALEINPLSHNFLADMGQIYYHNREYDKAKEYCQKALELYPDFQFAYWYLFQIYLKTGEYDKAIEAKIKGIEVTNQYSIVSAGRAKNSKDFADFTRELYREGGIEGYFRTLSKDSAAIKQHYSSAMEYAFLSEKEKALDELEKASEHPQNFATVFLKVDPIFDSLRDEPRYQEILRKMNLQD